MKRFLIPEDLWDTGLLEQWLEEQAARGWMPVSFGGLWGKFEKREPKATRFRLEPGRAESSDSRQEREAAYGELGWQYAADLGDYRVWYCDDPGAPELYTDPMSLSWAWDRQLRRLRRNGAICVLLILLWAAWQFRLVWSGNPVERFLYGWWAIWAFVLWWAGRGLWDTARQLRAARALRRKFAAGIAPDHTGNVAKALKRRRRREIADWIAIGLLALYCVFVSVTGNSGDLTQAAEPLPYVTMETLDLESAAQEMDWQQYKEDWDLLVPYRCEVEQFCWDFGPKLEARFDRTRFAFLAELLYRERLAAAERETPGLETTAVEVPGLDEAMLFTGAQGSDGRCIQIFLGRRGTAVLWEYTILNTDLQAHLDAFAQVLAEFSTEKEGPV